MGSNVTLWYMLSLADPLVLPSPALLATGRRYNLAGIGGPPQPSQALSSKGLHLSLRVGLASTAEASMKLAFLDGDWRAVHHLQLGN